MGLTIKTFIYLPFSGKLTGFFVTTLTVSYITSTYVFIDELTSRTYIMVPTLFLFAFDVIAGFINRNNQALVNKTEFKSRPSFEIFIEIVMLIPSVICVTSSTSKRLLMVINPLRIWNIFYCYYTLLPALSSTMVIPIGPCVIVIGGTCPDPSISFYLFTRKNPDNAQKVVVYPKWDNISLSNFNISHPSKFLIHGYNGNMNLGPLMDIKTEYLLKGEHNIWAINWPSLCEAPCYPMAAYNTRHTGECLANFITRLRQYHPLPDIHIIGFSLGAHVAAFTANHLRPHYTLPRITGLDPAMPLFMTSNKDHKLDPSDARFVDILHTNAFVQGKPDQCGHVDFYMNGGINQPGCFSHSNPIGCDHHRSLMYFAESIRSHDGFWGWPCSGMIAYLKNDCPPRGEPVLMGDNVSQTARGYFLVYTAATSPYALGRWTGGDTTRTRWQRLVHRRGGRQEIETYLV